MPSYTSNTTVRLFYSYSHKDQRHRQDMETILATLKLKGFLRDWSDRLILPGQQISAAIPSMQSKSAIHAFLLSPDFLNSEECLKEWHRAKTLEENGQLVFRVPIILRDCPWRDFLAQDDVKALPDDGRPIVTYDNADAAWLQVYEGIKAVVEHIRTSFTARNAFLENLNSIDLPSSTPITLPSLFVFPNLRKYEYTGNATDIRETVIVSTSDLHRQGHSMIHGQERSGKTALAKHLTLSLIEDDQPVLFADLAGATGRPVRKTLRRLYEEQFHGDYDLWLRQDNKSLIVDNMAATPGLLDFIVQCVSLFSHILIFVSSDVYYSFLLDERQLSAFNQIRLEPLTYKQQEDLIRKRLATLNRDDIDDGFVDHVEDRVDSIIISSKIVPRYPFFVLAIVQTYDTPMYASTASTITSYGHCYFVFILASLQRADISLEDDKVNACFNFAERLALATFEAKRNPEGAPFDFATFRDGYLDEFIMEQSLLSRMTHPEYGIIASDGSFKTSYMYYFFLGKALATNPKLAGSYLPDLCEHSDVNRNYLTLIFAIHHASDDTIIRDIMSKTMTHLADSDIATLWEEETSTFSSMVLEIPETVLSADPVEEERARERHAKNALEEEVDDVDGSDGPDSAAIERIELSRLRILKNNKILAQVLRNQYGKLPRHQIEEIVQAIADSSFRLVNLLLLDENELRNVAHYIHMKFPDVDLAHIRRIVGWMAFISTLAYIDQAVHAVNVPAIREAVNAVVARNGTPAYKVLGYFYQLDSGEKLTSSVRKMLAELYKEHQDVFVRRLLSLRTQMYMNTHRSDVPIEQAICAVLEIQYRPRSRASVVRVLSG